MKAILRSSSFRKPLKNQAFRYDTPHPPQRWRAAACALTLATSAACASAPPPDDELPSAETYYQRGLEELGGRRVMLFFHDTDYKRAIELFQEVIDNYPYSDSATQAELKIADVYFQQEEYEQAATYYQDFVERRPKHEQVPYALYRQGLCYAQRMREPDQDQEAARTAAAQFKVLLERYPESEHAASAREQLAAATDRLSSHETHVGDFYLERGQCGAAVERYRGALVSYPDHGGRLVTMRKLAAALRCAGRDDEAVALLGRILAEEPDSQLRDEVEGELRALGATFPAGKRN